MAVLKKKEPTQKESLAGKKLLILSGGFLNISLVKEAKKLGLITYVADYGDSVHSPAKTIADKRVDIDLFDVDALIDLCKKEEIDGVISLFYNVSLSTYYTLCEKLGYYCFATREQFACFASKINLYELCKECGVDIPIIYNQDELTRDFNSYPVLVKPDEGSGSKGQKISRNYEELMEDIKNAEAFSTNHQAVIEEYIDAPCVLTAECVIKNGEVATVGLFEMHNGDREAGLDRVYEVFLISKDTRALFKTEFENDIKKIVKQSGMQNGFLVIQGMKSKDSFKIIDASARMGGGLFSLEKLPASVNLQKIAIQYALTGELDCDINQLNHCYEKNEKIIIERYIILNKGKIARVEGVDDIRKNKHFVNMEERLHVGDTVEETGDVKQLYGGIMLSFTSKEELYQFFETDRFQIKVYDENNHNLVVDDFERCREIIHNSDL